MAVQSQENQPGGSAFLLKMLIMVLVIGIAVLAVMLGVRHAGPMISTVLEMTHLLPQSSSSNGLTGSADLEQQIRTIATGLDVTPADITMRMADQGSIRELRIKVPQGRPIEYVVLAMTQAARGTPYQVQDCIESKKKQTCVITYTSADQNHSEIRVLLSQPERFAEGTGRIALLITDFGIIADQTAIDFLSFPEPLSLAIASGPDRSEWTSQIADYHKKEVAILLPMEPLVLVPSQRSESMIMVHFNDTKVQDIISRSTKSIPRFSGFCVFMGSRALEDTRITTMVLSDIKKNRGYFIDTRDKPSARAADIARSLKVPYAVVDAVIPRDARETAIDTMLMSFAVAAQKKGTLLVRGSCTPALALTLRKRAPWIRQNGISFIYTSQIFDRKGVRRN